MAQEQLSTASVKIDQCESLLRAKAEQMYEMETQIENQERLQQQIIDKNLMIEELRNTIDKLENNLIEETKKLRFFFCTLQHCTHNSRFFVCLYCCFFLLFRRELIDDQLQRSQQNFQQVLQKDQMEFEQLSKMLQVCLFFFAFFLRFLHNFTIVFVCVLLLGC